MKMIALLGSTGSIGINTLDIVRQNPDRFAVASMAAGSNVELFAQQVKEFKGYGQGVGVYHSPVNTKAHFSNLLLTIAQKMGVETKTFADSNGVISEVLS